MYLTLLSALVFGFWLILSGYWSSPLLLFFGVISTMTCIYFCWRIRRQYQLYSPYRILYRFPVYGKWLCVEIFKANIAVVKNIWFPKQFPISPSVAKIPMQQTSRLGQAIFANSITLTPGTVAFIVKDNEVIVHAIVKDAIVELQEGDMNPNVAALEK